jgi:hypothetical protein
MVLRQFFAQLVVALVEVLETQVTLVAAAVVVEHQHL